MPAHARAREHFLRQLRTTPLSSDPSPHLCIAPALPPDYFEEIIRLLPHVRHYRPARGWRHTRQACESLLGRPGRKHELWVKHLWEGEVGSVEPPVEMRAFWAGLHEWLASEEVLHTLAECCAIDTTRPLRASVRLVREEDAIYVAPHLDRAFKLLTLLFYLPTSSLESVQGTTLYRRGDDGSLTKLATMPFAPNTALVMARTEESWHGVEPHLHPGRRDTLHLYLREDEDG